MDLFPALSLFMEDWVLTLPEADFEATLVGVAALADVLPLDWLLSLAEAPAVVVEGVAIFELEATVGMGTIGTLGIGGAAAGVVMVCAKATVGMEASVTILKAGFLETSFKASSKDSVKNEKFLTVSGAVL